MATSPSTTAPSRRRVQAALRRAQKDGTEITVGGIATAAESTATFIYRALISSPPSRPATAPR